MFASHTQQLMSEELYVATTGRWQQVLMAEYGDKVIKNRMKVSPFELLVNYDVKMRDGSVPGSNFSQVWVKMFELISQEPRLQQQFDIVRIFKHIARNSGAKNVEEFEVKAMPDAQVVDQVQAGNMIPMNEAVQGGMI
jgi:hypothetical protein